MIICVCISVESKQKLYASLNISVKNISVKDKFNVSTFENS